MKKQTNSLKMIALCIVTFLAFSLSSKTFAQSANLEIAPQEYADLAEKAINHLVKLDFDAWGVMLADDVEYNFPDGDVSTRTKLLGKKAVVEWWKNWVKTSGIISMTADEVNSLPINMLTVRKGGARKGYLVYSFFSNKLVFAKGSTALRMNFIAHFNADKKIDSYVTYYDRTPIIKAMGKDALKK